MPYTLPLKSGLEFSWYLWHSHRIAQKSSAEKQNAVDRGPSGKVRERKYKTHRNW